MLLKYSGLLAIIFAWVFVVTPSVIAGIDSRMQTITSATYNKKIKIYISLGLILGGLFQLIFSLFIIEKFSLHFSNIGFLLYSSTAIASIFVAVFSEQAYPAIHKFLVKYYFLVNPISIIFLGFFVFNAPLKISSLLIPVIYFSGLGLMFIKYKTANAHMEKWAFACLSVWTLLVTFL